MSDHRLDAMEYAMRPKEPRHLRGWRKAWSWLRSRPLARVRRTLATEQRVRAQVREGTPLLTFEEWLETSPWKALHDDWLEQRWIGRMCDEG